MTMKPVIIFDGEPGRISRHHMLDVFRVPAEKLTLIGDRYQLQGLSRDTIIYDPYHITVRSMAWAEAVHDRFENVVLGSKLCVLLITGRPVP